jgi:hypothetical protein
VSVRDADEARAAVAGGAEIIDAKDPRAGALGPVSSQALAEIRYTVPRTNPVSAALGDAPDHRAIRALIAGLEPGTLAFGKVGFAGCTEAQGVEAVRVAADALEEIGLVLVVYADWQSVSALSPEVVTELAARTGAAGLLLDTAGKGNGSLLNLWSVQQISEFVTRGRAAGLLVALGGGLGLADIPIAVSTGVEIIGVRGAACIGGRDGRVDRQQVSALRAAIDQAGSQSRIHPPIAARPSGPVIRSAMPAGSTRLK